MFARKPKFVPRPTKVPHRSELVNEESGETIVSFVWMDAVLMESPAWATLTHAQRDTYLTVNQRYWKEFNNGASKITISPTHLRGNGNKRKRGDFYSDLVALDMVGLIDYFRQGQASGSKNHFRLSERWRAYSRASKLSTKRDTPKAGTTKLSPKRDTRRQYKEAFKEEVSIKQEIPSHSIHDPLAFGRSIASPVLRVQQERNLDFPPDLWMGVSEAYATAVEICPVATAKDEHALRDALLALIGVPFPPLDTMIAAIGFKEAKKSATTTLQNGGNAKVVIETLAKIASAKHQDR